MITEQEIWGLLSNPHKATKKNFNADCPYCGKQGHFFINYLTGKNDCKKCGEAGTITKFLKVLGKLYLLAGAQVDIEKMPTLAGLRGPKEPPLDIHVPDIKMPIGFQALSYTANHPLTNYLKKRKLTKIDFELYTPGFTQLKQKYDDYVLLKVYRDYLVKGFIARYTGEDPERLRYLNSKSDFSKLLFGYDELIGRTETAILVEGVYDKTSVTTELGLHSDDSLKCLATFGKKVSEAHILLLKKTNISSIILLHDGRDAVNDMKKSSFRLQQAGFTVWVGFTRSSDPGDCTGSELFDIMNNIEPAEQFWLSKLHKRKFI